MIKIKFCAGVIFAQKVFYLLVEIPKKYCNNKTAIKQACTYYGNFIKGIELSIKYGGNQMQRFEELCTVLKNEMEKQKKETQDLLMDKMEKTIRDGDLATATSWKIIIEWALHNNII